MEPIEPPWQAIKEWIPDDEPDLDWFNRPQNPSNRNHDGFDQSPTWQPPERLLIPITNSTVRAVVSLIEENNDGYRPEVELHALLPGVDPEETKKIMTEAHVTYPYSKALRGDTAVTLVVD